MMSAWQYVGTCRSGAKSLKYGDAISKKHNKNDHRDTEISKQNHKFRKIFRVEHLKYMKYHE